MLRPNRRTLAAMAFCLLLWSAAASADFIPIAQPDAGYLGATTRLDFAEPDFDVVASLSDGSETVTFDTDLVALTVPTTWATWGPPPDTESATPRVLWTNGFNEMAMDLSVPVLTFGFEAQPDVPSPFDITVSFFSLGSLVGSTTLGVDGLGGARLFAATTSTDPFDRIEISSTTHFAIANLRYGTAQVVIPEPGSVALLFGGLLSGLALRHRRSIRARDPQ